MSRLREISEGIIIPPGEYNNATIDISFDSFRGRRLSVFGNANHGNFFDGHRSAVGGGLTSRFNSHLTASARWSHNRVRMPYGDFDTNLFITTLDFAFTPDLFGGALIQWNDVSDTLDFNLRLDFIHTPGSAHFLVYNQSMNTDRGPGEGRTNSRGGIAKVTYLFQF